MDAEIIAKRKTFAKARQEWAVQSRRMLQLNSQFAGMLVGLNQSGSTSVSCSLQNIREATAAPSSFQLPSTKPNQMPQQLEMNSPKCLLSNPMAATPPLKHNATVNVQSPVTAHFEAMDHQRLRFLNPQPRQIYQAPSVLRLESVEPSKWQDMALPLKMGIAEKPNHYCAEDAGQNGMASVIEENLLLDRIVERFDRLESDQRDFRKSVGEKLIAFDGYLDVITKILPQLNEKLEAFVESASFIRVAETPFSPVESEAQLKVLNEKSKDKEFIKKTIAAFGYFRGKNTTPNGKDVGYSVIDRFGTRKLFAKCTWTGSSLSERKKVCLSQYTGFINLIEAVIRYSAPNWTSIDNQNFLIKRILCNSMVRCRRKKQMRVCRRRPFGSKSDAGSDEDNEHYLDCGDLAESVDQI